MMSCTFQPSFALASTKAPTRSSGAAKLRAASARPARSISQRDVIVRAVAAESSGNPLKKYADLCWDEGPFNTTGELWNGRLAMIGFTTGLANEVWTGNPILHQINLPDGSETMAMGYCIAAGLATVTLSGALSTVLRASGGKMSKAELAKYTSFFRLSDDAMERRAALEMKMDGDFTSLESDRRIADAREGMAADKVLGLGGDQDAAALEAGALKASANVESRAEIQGAAQDLKESGGFLSSGAEYDEKLAAAAQACVVPERAATGADVFDAYARQVELDNGRAAMLGFAIAIAIEGFTGQGIIPQVIGWLKLSGLLGPLSGF